MGSGRNPEAPGAPCGCARDETPSLAIRARRRAGAELEKLLMRQDDRGFVFPPADLTGFLACPHRTTLNRAVAAGERTPARRVPEDPRDEALKERGALHERRLLEGMRREGRFVEEIGGPFDARGERTPTGRTSHRPVRTVRCPRRANPGRDASGSGSDLPGTPRAWRVAPVSRLPVARLPMRLMLFARAGRRVAPVPRLPVVSPAVERPLSRQFPTGGGNPAEAVDEDVRIEQRPHPGPLCPQPAFAGEAVPPAGAPDAEQLFPGSRSALVEIPRDGAPHPFGARNPDPAAHPGPLPRLIVGKRDDGAHDV